MNTGTSDGLCPTNEMLTKLLSETLAHDQETREAAKQRIEALEVAVEFGTCLAQIIIDPEGQLAVRQSASTALRLYVETRWRYLYDEKFELSEMTPQSKEQIKELLLVGLRESTSEIRLAVAQTICAIAQSDWPVKWPGLYDVLVDCLSQESDFAVHEAMQVLRVCIRHIDNTELPNIGPVILQAMYQIFQDENQYSEPIRSQAVEIFTTIVSFLIIPDYCEPDFILQSMLPMIPMFCDKFMQTLKKKNASISNKRLKSDVVKAIKMLTATLPKCLLDFLPKMLPLIWQTLAASAQAYQEHTVNTERHIDDEEIDSDGEVTDDCHTLIKSIFEFIDVLISGPCGYILNLSMYGLSNYQWFYLQDSLPPETIRHLMFFMEYTDKQINLWTHNPSQFLIEGEMDVIPNSIRSLARDLLVKIVGHPNRAAANALFVVTLKQIQSENAMRIIGLTRVTQHWWKSHETSLLAFCILKNIVVEKQEAETLDFDVIAFLENMVLADVKNSESHPLLVGRCLQLSGLYVDQMPPEMMLHFLKATKSGLESLPACIKICAAIAANSWFRAISIKENGINENVLRSHLLTMFKGLFDLGSQLMTAEGLRLILESFAILVTFDQTFIASVESEICTLTIAAVSNFYNDLSTLWACKKIFRELSLHPECREPLQLRLVPKLIDMMSVNPSDEPESGKVALDILQILVEHSPQPLSSILVEKAFPASCNCISSSHNHATLQSGGKLMCTYFSIDALQVIRYRDTNNRTGSQYILKVAGKLLEAQSSNLRIEDACELVISLIKSAEITVRENVNIQRLLIAVIRKMQCTEKIFIRRLLMVFAHVINTQLDMVLDFLSTIPVPAGQCNLMLVVFDGLCKEHKFFENNDRKIVNLALSKILEHGVTHNESRLSGGASTQGTEDGRTTMPLLVEICKLISNEFS